VFHRGNEPNSRQQSQQKGSGFWEGATSLGGVKGSLPQSSQPRHQGRRIMETNSVYMTRIK